MAKGKKRKTPVVKSRSGKPKRPGPVKPGRARVKVPAKNPILPARLLAYLEKAGVSHSVLVHKTVYTAYDAAATMKKKLDEIAKSLLVKADKDYYVAILPADRNLDMKKLGAVIGKACDRKVKMIKIPGEEIMAEVVKAKNMAITAFGGLHNLPVVAEKNLEKAKKLVFSSGQHNHSIEMKLKDFLKLEKPILGKFGIKKKLAKLK
ncbi:MAG: YbaK/EbsC family protein [Patescibacteria group bacterium]|jgi:Ala-tRNA(Pro) deacylase